MVLPSSNNEPMVAQVMRSFRQALLLREQGQMLEMAQRWAVIEQRLQANMLALASEIERLRANNQAVSRGKIQRLSVYRQLLRQVETELAGYADYADELVSQGQAEMGALGLSQAGDLLSTRLVETGRLTLDFARLPVTVIESLAGLAGDGSPLRALFVASWPAAVDGLMSELLQAVAQGQHPTVTAQRMARGFNIGLQRAMNIARTEQLRVYRFATLNQYAESGLCQGYRRMSARDSRVCPACLMADDGTIYPLTLTFEEHPQGRCTAVPVLIGEAPKPAWETGQAWFERQDEGTQRTILGKGHFEAWQAGKFELPQIVSRKTDPVWGTSLQPTPLRELVN